MSREFHIGDLDRLTAARLDLLEAAFFLDLLDTLETRARWSEHAPSLSCVAREKLASGLAVLDATYNDLLRIQRGRRGSPLSS